MNNFQLLGQTFEFLADAAVFLPDASALVVADLHLGKSATFRARGLPVPEGDSARDLTRLRNLIHETRPGMLIIAGDLFHSPAGIDADLNEMIDSFISAIGIPIHLVLGNHDLKVPVPPRLQPVKWLDLGGIRVVHNPEDASEQHVNISGHWHPVVKIRDGKRTALRLPCFLLRGRTLVLPSFGSFTGGALIDPEPGDRVFVPLRERVIELPAELLLQ